MLPHSSWSLRFFEDTKVDVVQRIHSAGWHGDDETPMHVLLLPGLDEDHSIMREGPYPDF